MQSENKLCVVLLFGGMSSEHEVSRVSVGNFVNNIDRTKYEVLAVGITKEGRWLYTEATAAQMADGSWEELAGNMPCILSPDRADHGMVLFTPEGHVEKLHVDVVIPVLHGLWGEDGTVQGLLELAGIPYVGCGVLASAACMDKGVANALFEANDIPHTKWLAANRWQIESDLEGVCAGVEAKLGWPVFVKPANAGSSVGISKVSNREELKKAIALALENDRKVVFEAFVDGQEVECAVIGSDPAVATRPGEILAGAEFYTYDDKYKNGVSQTVIPAHLPEEKLDEALGTVGHLRMDFGHGEKEFWHTWWPHNEDRFNTPEFKEVLQRFVDDLRQTGLLKNLGAMDAYCWQHGGSITEDRRSYGYIAETENYRFCLRCTPFPGEYQGYLYCYDLCQQEMYRQEHPVVGRVTFASGEQQEFTDSKALLQAIREELPFRSTTGFRFETLTDDPEVKKAVDDILLDFAGEDNSRRTCNYGLTETGKQALRKAADPSIPHTYAWFVMADTNTPQEIIRQDLTLEEAIQIYQDSNTSEKRLGVIKDGIATVDFVHFQSGEQQFFTDHEKLESFRSDLVVAEAMERLYQQLNQPDIGIRMGEM